MVLSKSHKAMTVSGIDVYWNFKWQNEMNDVNAPLYADSLIVQSVMAVEMFTWDLPLCICMTQYLTIAQVNIQ